MTGLLQQIGLVKGTSAVVLLKQLITLTQIETHMNELKQLHFTKYRI